MEKVHELTLNILRNKKNIIGRLNQPENLSKNNGTLNDIYNIDIKIKKYYNNLKINIIQYNDNIQKLD